MLAGCLLLSRSHPQDRPGGVRGGDLLLLQDVVRHLSVPVLPTTFQDCVVGHGVRGGGMLPRGAEDLRRLHRHPHHAEALDDLA